MVGQIEIPVFADGVSASYARLQTIDSVVELLRHPHTLDNKERYETAFFTSTLRELHSADLCKQENINGLTGLVFFDLDNLDEEKITQLWGTLIEKPT